MTIVKSFELKTGYLQKGKLVYLLKFIFLFFHGHINTAVSRAFLLFCPLCLPSEPLLCTLENYNDKNVVPYPRKDININRYSTV